MELSNRLLIVDYGNVLYDIDFQLTIDAFKNLPGYNGAEIRFGVDDQDEIFFAVDRGELTNEAFRQALRERFGFTCSDAELDDAWCAILKRPFPHAPQVIADLRERYPDTPMVLLSNISELHLAHVERQTLQGALGTWDMTPGTTFDALYFSCRTHLRKPDPAAFQKVYQDLGVEPADCILFDDSAVNCAAARSLGMRTVQVTPGDPHLAFREPSAV